MEKDTTTDFETIFKDDLYRYLLSHNEIDERLPEVPDLAGLWQKIAKAYMPDAKNVINRAFTVFFANSKILFASAINSKRQTDPCDILFPNQYSACLSKQWNPNGSVRK